MKLTTYLLSLLRNILDHAIEGCRLEGCSRIIYPVSKQGFPQNSWARVRTKSYISDQNSLLRQENMEKELPEKCTSWIVSSLILLWRNLKNTALSTPSTSPWWSRPVMRPGRCHCPSAGGREVGVILVDWICCLSSPLHIFNVLSPQGISTSSRHFIVTRVRFQDLLSFVPRVQWGSSLLIVLSGSLGSDQIW